MVSFYHPPLPDEPDIQVVTRWQNGRASCEELLALWRFLPEVRDRPASEVFRQARSSTGWVLAVCHPAEARRICELAERAGLVATVEPLRSRRTCDG